MRVVKVFGIAALIIACGVLTHARQTPPVVTTVSVTAAVSESSGVYTYRYKITNPRANTGSLWLIATDVSKSAGTIPLSDEGLNSDERLFQATSQINRDQLGDKLVAVGVGSPFGWNAMVTQSNTVQWNASDDTPLLAPGVTQDGFRLTSRGLPVIRHLQVEAYLDFNALRVADPAGAADIPRYKADVDAVRQKLSASALTIGPGAPPIQFDPEAFIRTLMAYKDQAVAAGWLRDQGIGRSLDAKLNAARAAVARGNTGTAANELNALLHEVEAQAGKQLSPESVALLKFNTQYLLSKLR